MEKSQMQPKTLPEAQKQALAARLATLPKEKQTLFRQRLEQEGIDPWQLPIIPSVPTDSGSETNAGSTLAEQGFPLSFSQQRLWFIDQLNGDDEAETTQTNTAHTKAMYNLFFALRFGSQLDVDRFSQAINRIVEKHPILRTRYIDENGTGKQIINSFEPFDISVTDLSLEKLESEQALQALLQQRTEQEAHKPFDLSHDKRLIRVQLSRLPASMNHDIIGFFTVHHIAFDAVSNVVFLQELNQFYSNPEQHNKHHNNHPKQQTSAADVKFHDFAMWQQEWAQSQAYQRQAEYWQKQLHNAPTSLNLATSFKRPNTLTHRGAQVKLVLPAALSQQIRALTQQTGSTLYMVMLAAFNVLLSRYSQSVNSGSEENISDICIGTSVANRSRRELQQALGFFVNTLVMRNQINESQSFATLLSDVKHTAANAFDNQDLPFDKLIELLDIERHDNISPLFQVMFVLNNALDDLALDLGTHKNTQADKPTETVPVSIFATPLYHARFDLTLRVTDGELATSNKHSPIQCDLEFNTDLYSPQMANNMLEHYQHLLQQIVADIHAPLAQLQLLNTAQQQQVLGFATAPEFKTLEIKTREIKAPEIKEQQELFPHNTIVAQFEHLVSTAPNATALLFRKQSDLPDVKDNHSESLCTLSYEQLNQQANQLAWHLLNQRELINSSQLNENRAKSQPRVGILLERSSEFVVSLLAILKTGAAYVPLDTKWPATRIAKIIESGQLTAIVSDANNSTLCAKIPEQLLVDANVEVNSDSKVEANLANSTTAGNPASHTNPNMTIAPNDAAYLIYTSGSTGEPKGVVIEHRNLLSYTAGVAIRANLAETNTAPNNLPNPPLTFGLISTVAADLGNTALFGALLTGGCLNIIDAECAADADSLADYLQLCEGTLKQSGNQSVHALDVLKIVPSHLQGLLTAAQLSGKAQQLLPKHSLILGGEACSQSLTEQIQQLLTAQPAQNQNQSQCQIINHYGPTETTVGALAYVYQAEKFQQDQPNLLHPNLPIGSPLPGYQAYVVNSQQQLCPPGVPGELWIAGAGVARGYLEPSDRFVANPFVNSNANSNVDSQAQNLCYRTGDKVRMLPSGEFEFIGRLNAQAQVKIRGYRVELGEVEASLRSMPGIEHAAAMVTKQETNQKISQETYQESRHHTQQLAAFVVLNKQTRLEAVKQQIGEYLPDYMTPQWWFPLDKLPVTDNGKLDRKELATKLQNLIANSEQGNLNSSKGKGLNHEKNQEQNQKLIQAPGNEKEQILADIWCQVLRLETVGVHDNFFDVGGDSILSLQIISRAKKAGLRLTPKQLFEQKTIAGMASVAKDLTSQSGNNQKAHAKASQKAKGFSGIGVQAHSANQTLEPAQPEWFGLTPIQHWFFDTQKSHNQQQESQQHWNQSVLFEIAPAQSHKPNQTTEQLYPPLQTAVQQLVNHHPALRLRFSQQTLATGSQWQQSVAEKCASSSENLNAYCQQITLADNTKKTLVSTIESLQKSLNIHTGPVFKTALISNSDTTYLYLVAHHLVVDGVSWRVLLSDLHGLLDNNTQEQTQKPTQELSQTDSYQEWVAQMQHYSSGFLQSAHNPAQEKPTTNVKANANAIDYWCHNQEVNGFPLTSTATNISEVNTIANMATVSRELSPALTQTLLQQVPAHYRTQITDILLTALATQLSNVQQGNHVLIELEGHGREAELAAGVNPLLSSYEQNPLDLSQTCGWFTTRYPVYLSPYSPNSDSASESPISTLKSIKEQLRAVPDKGLSFGALRYLNTSLSNEQLQQLKQRQQAPVSFNYLGQFNADYTSSALNLKPVTLRDDNGTPIDRKLDRAPNSQRPFLIDINSLIAQSQQHQGNTLQIEWHYCAALHSEQWMNRFADDFVQRLTQLIQAVVPGSVFSDAPLSEEPPSDEQPASYGATPSDFPLTQLTQPQLDNLDLPWHNVSSIYPLTPMQEGLLFHTQMNPGTGIYFMQYRYELNGSFEHQAFTQAWQQVVDRHDVLRTAFFRHDHQALQVVFKEVPPPVEILDWRDLSPAQQQEKLPQWMNEQLHQGFDLGQPTQLAITLIRMEEEKYQLIRSFHHILTDAWCFSLIMMDFLNFYHALTGEKSVTIAPAPRPFEDYVAWLQQQDMAAAEDFWRQNLAGFEAPTSLAVNTRTTETGVADALVHLSKQQTAHLQQAAQQHNVTLNTLVQAAWGLLVSRYSGDEDIVFGVTVAGRPTDLEGAETTVGLFINTLPLRVNASVAQSPQDYVTAIFNHNIALREHEFAPLTEIQRWSDVPAGQTLFNSLFVYENAPIDPQMYQQLAILEVGEMTNRTHTNYPITVVVFPEEQLGLQITYDRAQFESHTIDRMLGHFENLLLNLGQQLQSITAHETLPSSAATLTTIELLSEQEQRQQLIDWNQTHTDYPREYCWPQLFARQVETLAQTPGGSQAIAAAFEGEQLTYAQLYRRSQHIAQGLLARGVGANDIVAVLDERGLDLLVMIVGVLSAGAAYLPLDPKHPSQRIQQVIELATPKAVLCSHAMQSKLDNGESNTDSVTQYLTAEQLLTESTRSQNHIQAQFHPNNLAYVIYTSGSTGVPKGAMVEHLGMLNNLYSKIPTLNLSAQDVIAQTASQCFDISVWQLLTALLCGAKVQIYSDDTVRHPSALLSAMDEDRVTILEAVPSLIEAFLITTNSGSTAPNSQQQHSLSHLRWMMPTGEALSSDLVARWFAHYPNIPLINAYGPAECADDVSMWPMHNPADAPNDPVPIGRPTDNNRLYVLDTHQRLQPIGVPGEIYVAGAGVGRGYLNDAQRTQAVFIGNHLQQHPFNNSDNLANPERLYRTGDIARWRSDGVLEYLGRTDHQVKIRGFRIELGEIEAALTGAQTGTQPDASASVRHVAVLVKSASANESDNTQEQTSHKPNTDRLVAYLELAFTNSDEEQDSNSDISSRIGSQISSNISPAANLSAEHSAALTKHLRQQLPEYMVPTQFVVVNNMPLNRNGKIDRRVLQSDPQFALHLLQAGNADQQSGAVSSENQPKTKTEQQLAPLWQQILQLNPEQPLDIHASFFALGGHSLLAAQLHARVCQQFQIDLPLRTLYERNSISEVAQQVDLMLAAQAVIGGNAAEDISKTDMASHGSNKEGSNEQGSNVESEDYEEFEI